MSYSDMHPDICVFTVNEIARRLGLNRRSVYRLIADGRL
ncbi:helix-turn-helix domain-containing protein [Mobiluncus curtisii]